MLGVGWREGGVIRSCLVFVLYAVRDFSNITLKLEEDAIVVRVLWPEAGD
jgi:hypothetical protein